MIKNEKIDLTKRVYTLIGENVFFTSRDLIEKYIIKKYNIETHSLKHIEMKEIGNVMEDGFDIIDHTYDNLNIVVREYILVSDENQFDAIISLNLENK